MANSTEPQVHIPSPLGESPPELETIDITVDGAPGMEIGTVTLNRPEAFNAMSPELIGELGITAAWLADRAGVRAVIVTGSGPAFCSGGDVNWFKQGVEDPAVHLPTEVRRGAEALHVAITDFQRIPCPVIAAINGPAAGAGFSLALACDIRISSEAAFFAVAYGRIGASPDGGMTYFLPRVVGPSRALELMLEDPNMDAKRALEEGLVSAVVPADELMGAARDRAEELAAKAPFYVKTAKKLVKESLDHNLTEHLQLERHGIADSMGTADLQRGVKAFFNGDKPEFKGE